MGVTSFSFELVCSVTPARMFKASVLDIHNLAPKIMPTVILGAGLIEGDGGVGSVKQFKFTDAVPFSHVNERVDVLDKDNLEYKYTVTEGGDVGTKLISAIYHVKIVPAGNGGCLVKATAEFTPVPGVQYTDEEANIGKEGVMGMYQAVEAHLLENPAVCA